jgi:DNA-binding NarL/FixJ family response regulator
MSKNILLIDHSGEERLYYTNEFKRIQPSLQFYYASSAREGLRVLKRNKIDIVLIQKNLPAVNGLLLLSGIKYIRKFRNVKVFIYSDSIDEGYSSLAKMLGASGCIEKKADKSVVQRELNALLNPGLLAKYVFFQNRETTQLGNVTRGEESGKLADYD